MAPFRFQLLNEFNRGDVLAIFGFESPLAYLIGIRNAIIEMVIITYSGDGSPMSGKIIHVASATSRAAW